MTNADQKQKYIDPVCGMSVSPATAAAETCHNGIQIYFCAEACKETFVANPNKFAIEKRKSFWKRYLDRINKATGGRPPACH